jgi:hypothetical protein
MKEPDIHPKPTFMGHEMKWVSKYSDGSCYWGHCWKYTGPGGKLVVRAWPTQPNQNDDQFIDPPEVRLDFELKIKDNETETIFEGRCKTHNELLRLLQRAERQFKRLYLRVESDLQTLQDVMEGRDIRGPTVVPTRAP